MTLESAIGELREFHRTVSARIGLLEERYLARDRPYGLDRLLWEIGPDGAEVRDVRERLGLDSGYTSRLLRRLERDGLVTTGRSASDGRVRRVSLTDAGRAEVGVLDELSDRLVETIIAPLSQRQRDELVAAAATVTRLFTASAVRIAPADPASPPARHALERYFAVLAERFEHGFDPAVALPATSAEMRPPAGRFLLATLRSRPVGCVGLKIHADGEADVKRMWVDERLRGTGLGRRLLAAIEEAAREAGVRAVRLETNRSLTEAIGLYRSGGYQEARPFNDEPYADLWFHKSLAPRPVGGVAQPEAFLFQS